MTAQSEADASTIDISSIETRVVDTSRIDASSTEASTTDTTTIESSTTDTRAIETSATDIRTIETSATDVETVETNTTDVGTVEKNTISTRTIETSITALPEVTPAELQVQPSSSQVNEPMEINTEHEHTAASTAKQHVVEKEKQVEEEHVEDVEIDVVNVPAEKAKSPDLNHSSVIRTSHNPRKKSLSTPRRDRNHVRTLDFSTPPRKGATPRRAQTSPKGRGSQRKHLLKNRFSPGTAKKLSRAAKIVRAGLFQSPNSCLNEMQVSTLSTVDENVQEDTITKQVYTNSNSILTI